MVLLDTSFLLAYFWEGDFHHSKALKATSHFEEYTPFIPVGVFQELLTVLTYKASSEEALQVSRILLGPNPPAQILRLDENYFEETVKLFQELHPHRFSYVDLSLIALSRDLDVPVLTFDKALNVILAGEGHSII